MPDLPSKADKNKSGWTNIGSSSSCRTGCPAYANFFIFQIGPLFVKQGINPVITLFGTLCRNVLAAGRVSNTECTSDILILYDDFSDLQIGPQVELYSPL